MIFYKDELKAKEEEFEKIKEAFEREELLRKQVEHRNLILIEDNNELNHKLDMQIQKYCDAEILIANLNLKNESLEFSIQNLNLEIKAVKSNNEQLGVQVKQLESHLDLTRIDLTKRDEIIKLRDNQLGDLQNVGLQKDDIILKLTREKKRLEEANLSITGHLYDTNDKFDKLSKLKSSLEQKLDETELQLEREMKLKCELEKSKRKIELNMKLSESKCEDIERLNTELEDSLKRKEFEMNSITGKLEQEHIQVSSLHNRVKELLQKVDSLEDDVQSEKQCKIKFETQRFEIARELADTQKCLDEASQMTSIQIEANKKREQELAQLKNDMEKANLQHEITSSQLTKRHQETINELNNENNMIQKTIKK